MKGVSESVRAIRAIDEWIFRMFLALFALLPLLLGGRLVDFTSPMITGLATLETGVKSNADVPIKYQFMLFITVVVLLLYIYKNLSTRYTLEPHFIQIPLLVMFAAVLLSLLFSPWKVVALDGFYDLKEGTVTYLAYILLCFLAAHTAYDEKKLHYFLYALIPFVLVNIVLTILALSQFDMWQVPGVQEMLHPSRFGPIERKPVIYTTLGNPNYSSGFGGVTTILFTTMALLAQDLRIRWTSVAMAVGSWAIVVASLATSGFLTIVTLTPVVLFAGIKFGKGKQTAAVAAALALSFALSFGVLYKIQPAVWQETFGFFTQIVKDVTAETPAPPAPPTTPAQALPSGEFKLPELPPKGWGPGTGRLYIWKTTLEEVASRPLFGFGLDTLSYAFPQMEIDRYSQMNGMTSVTTKPHNGYLAVLYGAGIFALLGMLAAAALTAWHFLRYLLTRKEASPVVIALGAAWMAHMIQLLFNDSYIGASPIFWVLFGVTASLMVQSQAKAAEVPAKGAQLKARRA